MKCRICVQLRILVAELIDSRFVCNFMKCLKKKWYGDKECIFNPSSSEFLLALSIKRNARDLSPIMIYLRVTRLSINKNFNFERGPVPILGADSWSSHFSVRKVLQLPAQKKTSASSAVFPFPFFRYTILSSPIIIWIKIEDQLGVFNILFAWEQALPQEM